MIKYITNLIFPPKCIFCGKILNISSKLDICEYCINKVPFIDDKYFNQYKTNPQATYYDSVICVCEYSGIVRQSLMRYKFFNKPSYYRAFANLLADKVKRMTNVKEFDIIISVPLHKNKQHVRGYNQSFLISKALSKEIRIPEGSGALARVVNTGSQSLMTRTERGINVKGAFKVTSADKVKGKVILLVDDVFTTGNTVNECSRLLKDAGAKKVVAVTVAKAVKRL